MIRPPKLCPTKTRSRARSCDILDQSLRPLRPRILGEPLHCAELLGGYDVRSFPQDSKAWSLPHLFANMSRDYNRTLECDYEWGAEGLEEGNRESRKQSGYYRSPLTCRAESAMSRSCRGWIPSREQK